MMTKEEGRPGRGGPSVIKGGGDDNSHTIAKIPQSNRDAFTRPAATRTRRSARQTPTGQQGAPRVVLAADAIAADDNTPHAPRAGVRPDRAVNGSQTPTGAPREQQAAPPASEPATAGRAAHGTPVRRFEWERAIRDDPTVTGTRMLVLLTVGTFLGLDGRGFVGMAQLAQAMGVSDSTIRRHLRWAREVGWLTRTRRGHRSGETPLASEYELALPLSVTQVTGSEAPSQPVTYVTDRDSQAVTQVTGRDAPQPVKSTPQPVKTAPSTGHPDDRPLSLTTGPKARGEDQTDARPVSRASKTGEPQEQDKIIQLVVGETGWSAEAAQQWAAEKLSNAHGPVRDPLAYLKACLDREPKYPYAEPGTVRHRFLGECTTAIHAYLKERLGQHAPAEMVREFVIEYDEGGDEYYPINKAIMRHARAACAKHEESDAGSVAVFVAYARAVIEGKAERIRTTQTPGLCKECGEPLDPFLIKAEFSKHPTCYPVAHR